VISRNTQGVKLIDIDTNERLVSAARLAEQEDSESGDDGEASDDMDQEQDEENGD
jgi:DNA gyrase subunit A